MNGHFSARGIRPKIGGHVLHRDVRNVSRLALHGARVMVCDKVASKKPGVRHQNISFMECDVSDKDDFERVFIETKAKLGHVNVLFNNAGIIRENEYEGSSCFQTMS